MEAEGAGFLGGGLGEDAFAGLGSHFEVVVPANVPGGVLEHEDVVVSEIYGVEELFVCLLATDAEESMTRGVTESVFDGDGSA